MRKNLAFQIKTAMLFPVCFLMPNYLFKISHETPKNVKKTSFSIQKAKVNVNCIVYPKKPQFMEILKNTKCAEFPLKVAIDEKVKNDFSFNFKDSVYFANCLIKAKLHAINIKLNGPAGCLDDLFKFDINGGRLPKFVPVSFIYDSPQFTVISIANYYSSYLNYSIVCSFTKDGKYIDGFLAYFSSGHDGLNQSRHTTINKNLTILIKEESDYPTSASDYSILETNWKFLKDGKLKKITEKIKYGEDFDFHRDN